MSLMKRLLIDVIGFLALLVVVADANAAACKADTLDTYLVKNFSCDLGDVTFINFTATIAAPPTLKAKNIKVTPSKTANHATLEFSGFPNSDFDSMGMNVSYDAIEINLAKKVIRKVAVVMKGIQEATNTAVWKEGDGVVKTTLKYSTGAGEDTVVAVSTNPLATSKAADAEFAKVVTVRISLDMAINNKPKVAGGNGGGKFTAVEQQVFFK